MSLNFSDFNVGTLFLVRTPETFPVGYADECMRDMKNMHFDFVAHLETWNCEDGILWKSDKYPRSSYWKDEDRDPMEECFLAADKYDLAFLPEAGVMHDQYILDNEDAMQISYEGKRSRYGRIGLSPVCPKTLEFLKDKYDALYEKFGHHKSFQGFCLPSENSGSISYDRYTKEAWQKLYGRDLPSTAEIAADKELEAKVVKFLEDNFTALYRELAQYLKEKYNLPLMQYPLNKISNNSYFQPSWIFTNDILRLMCEIDEIDLVNLQLHPPLNPNPYFHKFETEFLMANSLGRPCMADTHFYHESAAGRLPDTTPKRIVDSILSTLTPYGISFFCYGFMAQELPLWKKELNPGAPVFKAYCEPHTVAARREMAVKAMDYVEILRNMLQYTENQADCAIYYPESMDKENMYASYPMEHIFGLYELFSAAGVPVKVTASIPADGSEQKLLVMDSVKNLSPDNCKKLENYLANGGKLIIIGKCCKEIEKIAGISTAMSDGLFVQSEKSGEYNHFYLKVPADGKHYTEAKGTPVLMYENKTPAITTLGNVLYIGISDSVGRFNLYRDFRLASWWKEYFTTENLVSSVNFTNVYVNSTNGHQFTSCDVYGNEDKKLLFIRNFGVEQCGSSVTWEIPENMQITKAYSDGEEFEFESGKTLPTFEHFVAVLAERK